ncbi:MAG: Rdx family protein [Bdellovibrionales bacterium]|nr:Rdx family protein [Bdellovibrionales bacterium]
MSAEIQNIPELKVRLIEGSRGIFDVKADGKLVFSKFKLGRFPKAGEIRALLG